MITSHRIPGENSYHLSNMYFQKVMNQRIIPPMMDIKYFSDTKKNNSQGEQIFRSEHENKYIYR